MSLRSRTFLVLLHRCKAFAGHLQEQSFDAVKEYLQSLQTYDEINVPFSYEFLNILEQKKLRVRRDIDKILSLCQTSAFINQNNRPSCKVNDKKILFATPEDAYNVFTLAFPSFEETVTGLSKKLQTVYDAIPENDKIKYRDLSKNIGWHKRMVIRAVEELDNMNLVMIDTTSQTHEVSREEPIDKVIKDFQKYKKNFLLYTAVELCKNIGQCDIPLSWSDINATIDRDTNRDRLRQKNETNQENRDMNCDKTVTNFYSKDDLDEYFKNKDTITIKHFCHAFVTLSVTVSPSRDHALFKYRDTVTESTLEEPDIDLSFTVPHGHGVTPLNDKILDAKKIIDEHPEDNYEIIMNKYGQTFIDKGLERGIFTEPLLGKKLNFIGGAG